MVKFNPDLDVGAFGSRLVFWDRDPGNIHVNYGCIFEYPDPHTAKLKILNII